MPLFSSNRRAQTPQGQYAVSSASSSAATAAAQAFLKQQASNASLSAAAAAAALRSQTSTPVPIGELQTKRMARRGSTSSYGSVSGSVRQPFTSGLQRRGSNSSMTERSFRAMSPGPANFPPLPEDAVPPIPTKSHKRLSSSDLSPVGARVTSPTPSNTGRPVQANTGARMTAAASRDGARSPESIRSVNFSRPMSPDLHPRTQPRARPASSLAYSSTEGMTQIQIERAAAAQRKQMMAGGALHSRQATSPLAAGALAAATAAGAGNITTQRALPRQAAAQTLSPAQARAAAFIQARKESMAARDAQPIPIARSASTAGYNRVPLGSTATPTYNRPSSALAQSRPLSPPPVAAARPVVVAALTASRSAAIAKAQAMSSARPGSQNVALPAALKPAMKSANTSYDQQERAVAAPAAPSPAAAVAAQAVARQPERAMSPSAMQPATITRPAEPRATGMQDLIPSPSAEQMKRFQAREAQAKAASMLARPRHDEVAGSASASENVSPEIEPENKSTPQRTQLTAAAISDMERANAPSPSRQHAHFSAVPVQAATKHTPPPRALSPFKSAMKGSSPRSASPVGSHPGKALSDTSDARSEDGSQYTASGKKKKSVRVSFEERPILVGEAAGTAATESVLSPQYKRFPNATNLDVEQGDSMAPRPALPSFGSVRARAAAPEIESTPGVEPINFTHVDSHTLTPVRAIPGMNSATDDTIEEEDDDEVINKSALTVPSINILPGTPGLEEGDQKIMTTQELHVPEKSSMAESPLTAENLGSLVDSRPRDVRETTLTSAVDEGSDVDGSEVFTDAAEQPTEAQNAPGFVSLDAIIESPSAEVDNSELVPAITDVTASGVPGTAVTTDATTKSNGVEDWERERSYWSSLSEHRKRELEAEADRALNRKKTTAASAGHQTTKQAQKLPGSESAELPPWPDKQFQQTSKSTTLSKTMRDHERTSAEQPHMRQSMRNTTNIQTGGMRSSMRGSNVAAQSYPPMSPYDEDEPRSPQSPIASAPLKSAMAKPKLVRQDSNDSDGSESSFKRKRRGKNSNTGGRYTMARSMRAPAPEPERALSPASNRGSMRSPEPSIISSNGGRMSMRSSMRGVPDTGRSLRSGGGGGHQKKNSTGIFGLGKTTKGGAGGAGGGSRFRSRFDDSSDEEDGPAFFKSRFGNSDDESSPATSPRKNTFRPVRGFSRKAGQDNGDSSDLSDSDNQQSRQTARKPMANPVTVPSLGPVSTAAITNGVAGGNALGAGTLRDSNVPESPGRNGKRGFLGFGKKKDRMQQPHIPTNTNGETRPSDIVRPATPPPQAASTLTPAVVTAVASPPSSSKTKRVSRSVRNGEPGHPPQVSQGGRWSIRRLSFSSAQASPHQEMTKEDFPFPPPPIPESLREDTSQGRPVTSDGVSGRGSIRPPLTQRESAMTAPMSGTERAPVHSVRTGKKKKFQGLRRAFGLND